MAAMQCFLAAFIVASFITSILGADYCNGHDGQKYTSSSSCDLDCTSCLCLDTGSVKNVQWTCSSIEKALTTIAGWVIAVIVIGILIVCVCPCLICCVGICCCGWFGLRNRQSGGQVGYVSNSSNPQGVENPVTFYQQNGVPANQIQYQQSPGKPPGY